jgi:hypothetical protein
MVDTPLPHALDLAAVGYCHFGVAVGAVGNLAVGVEKNTVIDPAIPLQLPIASIELMPNFAGLAFFYAGLNRRTFSRRQIRQMAHPQNHLP